MTAWCSVPLFNRTLTILRRACSIAFCTATGTSFSLPLPIPTRPSPSPTTVNAANARMRPPFTTLVTRLMLIIFSRKPSPRSSCCCCLACCCLPIGFAISGLSLELQAAFTGGVGQCFYPSVVPVTGAIESDGFDAERLGLFGDALSDDRCARLVAAVLEILFHVGLERRSTGQYLVTGWRDDLRINVAVRPGHDQAVRPLLGDARAGLTGASDASLLFVHA